MAYAASLAAAFEDWAIARKAAAEERDRKARVLSLRCPDGADPLGGDIRGCGLPFGRKP